MTDAHPLPERVLLVGANYWPEESGNAPYTTGFAEDLAAHGVHVTALTAVPHYPGWRIREGYRGRRQVREQQGGVTLVRSWLWVPHHQSAAQRALFESSFLINSMLSGRLERPEVVIGITPSLSGAVAARILAQRFRVPYGIVVQDLVGPGAVQSGIRGGPTVSSVVRSVEGWAMRGASGIAIVSEPFGEYLRELGVAPGRISHIPNWSHIQPVGSDPRPIRERLGWPSGSPVVVHAGAMGLKQGLDQMVAAARLSNDSGRDIRFVFVGDGSQRPALVAAARGLSNVEFLPPQDGPSYADILVAADVLVISERPEMVNMSLPGKLTSYLAAGRPIVAAVPHGGATEAEVVRSGAGIVTPAGDAAALLAAAEQVIGDTSLAAELGAAGPRYADQMLDRARSLELLRSFVTELQGPADGE